MNNIERDLKNSDGTGEKMVATSNDNYEVKLGSGYTLANRKEFKQNKFADKFKNSALGADIGVHSTGFTNVAILATVIALSVAAILFFMWRF